MKAEIIKSAIFLVILTAMLIGGAIWAAVQ